MLSCHCGDCDPWEGPADYRTMRAALAEYHHDYGTGTPGLRA